VQNLAGPNIPDLNVVSIMLDCNQISGLGDGHMPGRVVHVNSSDGFFASEIKYNDW
jgi:hypothetical protein